MSNQRIKQIFSLSHQRTVGKVEFKTRILSTLEIEIKPLENALKDRCQINMARKLVSRT